MEKRSRTNDQMVQAARSGRQNIAEGSRAGATSSKSELYLTNVARGSLDELLLDYEDYLRHRKLRLWDKDDAEALAVRRIRWRGDRSDPSDRIDDPSDAGDRARWKLYAAWLEDGDAVVAANTILCLIHQANYLLDQEIIALERDFIQEGGYTEQLAAARIAQRAKASAPTPATGLPDCPKCGKPMTVRTARQGKNAGSQFLGCSGYPECRETLPMDRTDPTDRTD